MCFMCVDGRDIYVPLWCIPRTRCVFINHRIFDIYQFKVTQATTIPPPNLPSVLLLLLLLSPPPPPSSIYYLFIKRFHTEDKRVLPC